MNSENTNITRASQATDGTVTRRRRVGANVVYDNAVTRHAEPPTGMDREKWRAELRQALGTTSDPFVDACLHRLIHAANLPSQTVTSPIALSAALALIQSLAPENEIQAALAVDVAVLHAASTYMLGRMHRYSTDRAMAGIAGTAARLERAFHSSVEVYYRVKRGNTQVIRIEKVEVQAGGQAVVGVVA